MKTPRILLAALALALAFILHPSSLLLAQGPLTPPGAPAATMKTLQQIEPRIDLQNAPASAAVTTTSVSYHYIITQPGSYYLSANLGVTKTNGIMINAEGVTLDLNGFEISRTSGSVGNGIEIPATAHRASVRNGSIKGFAYGIRSLISTDYAHGCGFRDLSVSGCTTYGIQAGRGAVLESCRAHDNSGTSGISANPGSSLANCTAIGNTVSGSGIFADDGSSLTNCTAIGNTANSAGIAVGNGSSLTNCMASGNTGTYGIFANIGSTLTNCAARSNTATYGIRANDGSTLINCAASGNTSTYGIYANHGSTLTNCSASNNTSTAATSAGIHTGNSVTIMGCSSYSNDSTAGTLTNTTGMGFNLGFVSTIQNCTAYANTGDGIRLPSGSSASGNTSAANGSGGDGAGIHATGNDSRIEGNNVTSNDGGIDVDVAGNVIIKNTASANTTNYEIVANNVFGAIVDRSAPASAAVSGNSAASSAVTTDPWANISY